MKKEQSLASFLLIFISLVMFLPHASAQKRLQADDKSFEISRQRVSIIEKFDSSDMKAARATREYIKNTLEDETHLGFFPTEYWLLCFFTNDLKNILDDKFLNDIRSYDSQGVDLPVLDNMGDWLRKHGRNHSSELIQTIAKSSVSAKEKELLTVVLWYSLRMKNDYKDTLQVSLNQKAKKFTAENPSSQATFFLTSYVIREYQGTGSAQELSFGGGFFQPTAGLATYFKPGFTINIDAKQFLSNLIIGASAVLSSGYTKQAFNTTKNKFIDKNSAYYSYYLGIDLGAKLFENNTLAACAFGGPAVSDFTVTYEEKSLNSTPISKTSNLKNPASAHACLAVDFKFLKSGKFAHFKALDDFCKYNFIRLKYEYQHHFLNKSYNGFNGGLHAISLCIGSHAKKITRIQ